MLAVLTAILIRLTVAVFLLPGFLQPGRDHWEFGYEMGRVARSIAQGHGFANPYWMPTGPTAELPPVYPYLVAGVLKVLGVDTAASALAILSLNSLFSAFTCAPIFLIAREIVGERAAKWALWAWAFCPYSIYFSAGTMWYHGLVGMLLVWQVWFVLRLAESNQKRHWLALGALGAAQALVDPTTLGVLPLLIGWVGWRLHWRGDKWLARAAGSLAIVVLAITPWLVRNYEVFHKPVFLRDGFWLEVYVGNVGNSLHWWNTAIHPAGSASEQAEYLKLGELGYMELKKQQAIAYIKAHPATFAFRSLRRVVFMWTGFWSLNREYLQQEPLDRINFFFCFPLTILMLFALRRLFREAPDKALLFALLLLVFPLPYYFAHPDLTYRQPVEPIIILLAAYTLAPARESAFEPAAHSPEPEQAYGLRTLEPRSSFFD